MSLVETKLLSMHYGGFFKLSRRGSFDVMFSACAGD